MPWTPPPSLLNLLRVSIPVFHHAPNPEVHLVQGYAVLMSAVSEIVAARSVYQWNCFSLVPFMFSLYIHYFPYSHVFHDFSVIGCLQNGQQQRTPDQIQKDRGVLYVQQNFHFRARFLYPRQYSQMHCFGAKHGAALNPRLSNEQCPPPPS